MASRQSRWDDATADLREGVDELRNLAEAGSEGFSLSEWDKYVGKVEAGINGIEELIGEYQDWYDNLPENFQQNSPVGEKLQAIIDIDFESARTECEHLGLDIQGKTPEEINTLLEEVELDEIESLTSECESAELPRGFGRD